MTASPIPDVDGSANRSSVARGVLVSTGSQLLAKVVHLGVNIVSSLAIIHHLGPDGYGEYVLVVTVVGIAGLVGDFGLNKVTVREITIAPADEFGLLGGLLTARFGLGLVAMGLTQVALLAIGASAEARAAGLVLSTMALVEAALAMFVAFHVRLEQQFEAAVRVGIEAAETVLVLVLIARGAGLVALVAAPVLAAALGIVVAAMVMRRRLGWLPRPTTVVVGRLLRAALPVGPALLIAAVYLRIASVLLAWRSTPTEVGLYGAAYQPVEYLLLAAAVLVNVLLPLLVRAHRDDHDRFVAIYRRGTEALVGTTLVIAVSTTALAPWLVDAAFGPGYSGAVGPMRILVVALVSMVVSFWQSYVLLAAGHQAVTLRYDVAALLVTVTLSLVLVPHLGGAGAATSICIASILVVVWGSRALRSRASASLDAGRLLLIGAAAAAMVAVCAAGAAAGLPIGAAVTLAVLADLGVLVLVGVLEPRDLVAQLAIVRQRAVPSS